MGEPANVKRMHSRNRIPTVSDHKEQLPELDRQRPSARCCRSPAHKRWTPTQGISKSRPMQQNREIKNGKKKERIPEKRRRSVHEGVGQLLSSTSPTGLLARFGEPVRTFLTIRQSEYDVL
jgi:hypothetical protein